MKMRYGIDIFSGAGGLSLGAEMAGIRISSAIEINPHAAKKLVWGFKPPKDVYIETDTDPVSLL